MNKICASCKENKDIGEYYVNRTYGNQLFSKCKKCFNAYSFIRFKKNIKVSGSYAWFYKRYFRLKTTAKRRKIKFDLGFHDWKKIRESEYCFYCNEIIPTLNADDRLDRGKSIDRINNDLGYSITNCVLACHRCNTLKSNYKKEDIPNIIKIYKKIHKKM